MTKNKDQKRLIRARKAKTGESYTSAHDHFMRSAAPSVPAQPEQAAEPEVLEIPRARLPYSGFDPEADMLEARSRLYRTRVVHEASGRWVARSDDYPELRGEGEDEKQARQALVAWIHHAALEAHRRAYGTPAIDGVNEPVTFTEDVGADDFYWRDAVDDETAFYLENQDDD